MKPILQKLHHLHLSQKLSYQHLLDKIASIMTFLHSGQWSSAGKLSATLLDMSWGSSAGMTSSKLDTIGINELVLLQSYFLLP
jgi:hypothetical protein